MMGKIDVFNDHQKTQNIMFSLALFLAVMKYQVFIDNYLVFQRRDE